MICSNPIINHYQAISEEHDDHTTNYCHYACAYSNVSKDIKYSTFALQLQTMIELQYQIQKIRHKLCNGRYMLGNTCCCVFTVSSILFKTNH